jgi:hypothetical protein
MLFQLITFTCQKLEVQTTKINPKAETNRILAAGTVKQVYNVISLIQRLFAIAINLATRHVVPYTFGFWRILHRTTYTVEWWPCSCTCFVRSTFADMLRSGSSKSAKSDCDFPHHGLLEFSISQSGKSGSCMA